MGYHKISVNSRCFNLLDGSLQLPVAVNPGGICEHHTPGVAPALRKWGGQEIKLIARRSMFFKLFCLEINANLRKWGGSTLVHPVCWATLAICHNFTP